MSIEREKARFESNRYDARLQATQNLRLGVEFTLTGWGERAKEAYADQWLNHCTPQFDWERIFRIHRDLDRLDLVIWGPGGRLSGLALGLTTPQAVIMSFIEGDPRPDCPLKGKRVLIGLECGTCYGQVRGRTEIRIQPINKRLEELYRQEYGFVLETPGRGESYYRKDI